MPRVRLNPLEPIECSPKRRSSVALDPSADHRTPVDLGHRTVWHIAGPPDFLEAQARIDGWRSTLRAAGAPEPPLLVGDWSPGSGYALAEQLLAAADASAVFVGNDQMALGVLRRVYESGLRVPDRLPTRRRRQPRQSWLCRERDG